MRDSDVQREIDRMTKHYSNTDNPVDFPKSDNKMNPRIKELAHESGLPTYNPEGIPTKLEKFAELIVDECCVKLLDMDSKANGNHNYYKHAAIELKRHFKEI